MTTLYVRKVADLDADKAKWKIQGITGNATASTTTNLDWKFPQERWLSGGELLVQSGTWGDKVTLQIIDIDNVLGYGANTILDEFVTDFFIASDTQKQAIMECPYVALIPENVYARIKYTNVGIASTNFSMNLLTHIPRA